MSSSSNTDASQLSTGTQSTHTLLDQFPLNTTFTTPEQMRRFELLRLAFFVLKLRKLDQQSPPHPDDERGNNDSFRRNLLQHVIFQQIVTLTRLDAREQAMQIISTCHSQRQR